MTFVQIIARRQAIETELVEMLREAESEFTLEHIRDIVYNEEGQDDMMKIVAMFDSGQGASELENILELVTDAWNYFPHKLLEGLSPAEMILKKR